MESESATSHEITALLGQLKQLIDHEIKNSTEDRTRLGWVRQSCKVADLLIAYERNTDLRTRIEKAEGVIDSIQQVYFDSLRRKKGTESDRVA